MDKATLTIKVHLALKILSEFGGFFGGAFIVGYILDGGPLFLLGALGLALPIRYLFSYVIPAKCPKCGHRAYPRGSSPLTYVCRSCDYVYETCWSEHGDGGGSP